MGRVLLLYLVGPATRAWLRALDCAEEIRKSCLSLMLIGVVLMVIGGETESLSLLILGLGLLFGGGLLSTINTAISLTSYQQLSDAVVEEVLNDVR